ncbi:2-acylglycerol O-acyltransferase 1-like isoform X2 [Apostichopus japonicus]|uniref:2-acylglycerol O-acyltransferase 1-like isoform X2 n=1 Tax=Stichopus japonicus TaxID=307972 RepID=UPI003AB524E9
MVSVNNFHGNNCLDSRRKSHTMDAKSNRFSFLGVKWAPLSIPIHRRVETLSMFHYWYMFLLGCVSSFFLVTYLAISRYYIILLIFATYIYLDRHTPERGGRRSQWFRKLAVFRYLAEYFPMKLHKTVDLDPNKTYLGGFHPHGIMATGLFIHFGTEGTYFSELFPGITSHVLTLGGWFNFPLIRDYIMLTGICSVSRPSVDFLLTQPGHMTCIAVGGAKESLLSRPGVHKLYLQNRKGFIKRAVTAGACLVPIYSFGETNMYNQADNPEGSLLKQFQDLATKYFGFAPPLFHGRGFFNYSFGLLPHRVKVDTVGE